MNIIAITDIHGSLNMSSAVAALRNADLILIAGDITHFGNREDANTVLEGILHVNSTVLAVPGNCDQMSVNQVLTERNINLHGETRIIDDCAFYGLGGSNRSPFNTPQEYGESEIEAILGRFEKQDARYHILVSHPPPEKTKLDRTVLGKHVGSKSVRSFIEKFEPHLVLCGHIHEARGVDKIYNTAIINPGPFPKHYAVINVKDTLTYGLH